ncbi:hypothetical protein LOTGIDRAFT_173012 [Lottia gigantea]|uniref:EGF-like domain-containing protein n=1 Tax=Lottia gigantea TaxID=225164 RepID=V4CFV0_LOTGI|nr:hypothetical protein LOTGIDRAFT_173012 [Lottia gigantea]ESP00910.1 hypothetical protein LOTGIDRAFT_173012 [Lottia gigantea]
MASNQTKKCSLTCQNGGFCQMVREVMQCSCPPEYTGNQCESATSSSSTSPQPLDDPAHTEDDGDSNLWIIGLILGLVLIVVFVSGLVYYLRSRNKDVSLVSMIKYRNPNLGKRCEEVEELVPEISFNNPSFQDCDDKPPLPPRNTPICRNLYNITPKNHVDSKLDCCPLGDEVLWVRILMVSQDQATGDWWMTIMDKTTRQSVDSAFMSRHSFCSNSTGSQ